MKTMRCIVKTAPGQGNLALQERPVPLPKPGEVLIKVKLAAICGTDVHIHEWTGFAAARMKPPVIIGHEFCGEIVDVGEGVDKRRIGELVSAESHVACHACALCRDGKENLCVNTRGIGVHFDGCFAEYTLIPAENAIACNPATPLEVSACMEPLGVAVYAAEMARVAGQTVAIVGCGPIGLMAISVVRMMGAKKIICLEPIALRAEAAKAMGADVVMAPTHGDIIAEVKAQSEGLGPDVVLEFSGNIRAIQAATQYLRPGGKMVAAGLPSQDVPLNFEKVFYRGIDLLGVSGREMYHTWKVMLGMLNAGLDISGVISHVLPLEQFDKAFDYMHAGSALKVLLRV